MMISAIAQWASAASGGVAALLWLWSAKVRMPLMIEHIDEGFFSGPKPVDDLDRLTMGLSKQSKLSAWAAGATGISIALQAISTLLAK